MKLIVAGSRSITDYNLVKHSIETLIKDQNLTISTIISGTARGVDSLGERWAREHNIPISRFPAKWKELGKYAGIKRNEEMVENADMLLACWDLKSSGTKHIISYASKVNIPVFVRFVYER